MAQREILTLNESTPQIEAPQTGDTYLAPVTLQAATGNEAALTLNYTTNKLTSGDDTGLLINQTDTASPGTSLLADFQVGGVSKVSIDNSGTMLLPQENDAAAPTLAFGDGNTGFYEEADNDLRISIAGTSEVGFNAARMMFKSDYKLVWSTGNVGGANAVTIEREATGVLGLNAASLQVDEMTAPAGVADGARIYAEDNGAGKTRLMVIFGTGAAQQIAIEP